MGRNERINIASSRKSAFWEAGYCGDLTAIQRCRVPLRFGESLN